MVPTETPTGNAQLDGLLSLMRQPVPEVAAERTKVFGAVRKSIGELQANLNALTQPQVKQLQVAIADYEARTKTVQVEIHGDLGTLRQQILNTHPAAATAPAGATAPPTDRPMTLEEYTNNSFPNPAERTGIAWNLRSLWYGLYRMAFGIGKMFGRRTAPIVSTAAPVNPPTEVATTGGTDIETLPQVGGQPQNLLALANSGLLRLGDARLSLIRTGTGPNEKYLFDIGTKRYELIIDDYAFEGGAVAPLSVSREFVANERQATTAIRFQDGNVVLIGEANIPLKGAVGGRTHIPRADFIAMIQSVVKQQAAGTNPVRFDNVNVRYTGMIQTTAGNPLFARMRGPVNQARVIPSIRFVEVPRT